MSFGRGQNREKREKLKEEECLRIHIIQISFLTGKLEWRDLFSDLSSNGELRKKKGKENVEI